MVHANELENMNEHSTKKENEELPKRENYESEY